MNEAGLMVMNAPAPIVREHRDEYAAVIGKKYREGVEAYRETGRLLREHKARLAQQGRRDWQKWVETHAGELGFGYTTATRLMKHCNDEVWQPEIVWGHANNQKDIKKSQAQCSTDANGQQDEDGADDESTDDVRKIRIECDPSLYKDEIVIRHARELALTLKRAEGELTKEQVNAICARVAKNWGRGRPPGRTA